MSRVQALKLMVYKKLRNDREAAYRRALKSVGFMPQTIDVLVERDRDWIESGK